MFRDLPQYRQSSGQPCLFQSPLNTAVINPTPHQIRSSRYYRPLISALTSFLTRAFSPIEESRTQVPRKRWGRIRLLPVRLLLRIAWSRQVRRSNIPQFSSSPSSPCPSIHTIPILIRKRYADPLFQQIQSSLRNLFSTRSEAHIKRYIFFLFFFSIPRQS